MANNRGSPTNPGAFIVTTYTSVALRQCGEESNLIEAKQRAYERFDAKVQELEPVVPATEPVTSPSVLSDRQPQSDVQEVRHAFVKHLGPFRTEALKQPRELIAAFSDEFTSDLATALVATNRIGHFAPEFKECLRAKISARQDELESAKAAIESEIDSLETVEKTVLGIAEWLTDKNETPFPHYEFSELQKLHEQLDDHCATLEAIATQRQADIRQSSGCLGIDIDHPALIEKLYTDLPVAYPGLADIAILTGVCTDVQDGVCRHITCRA